MDWNDEHAAALLARIDLKAQLVRFRIDDVTATNLRGIAPFLEEEIDGIIARFYEYIDRFPDLRAIVQGSNKAYLRASQRRHWLRLFHCQLDRNFVQDSLMVGIVHAQRRVAPQSYIAAYSFFQAELLRTIINSYNSSQAAALSISINKLIMLDMSISLNAYYSM